MLLHIPAQLSLGQRTSRGVSRSRGRGRDTGLALLYVVGIVAVGVVGLDEKHVRAKASRKPAADRLDCCPPRHRQAVRLRCFYHWRVTDAFH